MANIVTPSRISASALRRTPHPGRHRRPHRAPTPTPAPGTDADARTGHRHPHRLTDRPTGRPAPPSPRRTAPPSGRPGGVALRPSAATGDTPTKRIRLVNQAIARLSFLG
ncbi:hypothetical protein GCM10010517_75550 [Streptosporangium fragile]|uniref:Uncharacterized protein n=1 Tax=Streptosporangium fragile TaxID=46186 RepID=A0ABN3WD31_9ACTN